MLLIFNKQIVVQFLNMHQNVQTFIKMLLYIERWLSGSVTRFLSIFYFILVIQPIWDPDKQVQMVSLQNSFSRSRIIKNVVLCSKSYPRFFKLIFSIKVRRQNFCQQNSACSLPARNRTPCCVSQFWIVSLLRVWHAQC